MPRKRTSRAPIVQPPSGFKQCTFCGEVKPLDSFSANKRVPDGRQRQCKPCRSAAQKRDADRSPYMTKYRSRHRAQINATMEAYKQRNPQKVRARKLLNQAVYRGKLTRPAACSLCGAVGPVEGHHHDYSKPFEVQWLCGPCHKKTEAKDASTR